ncbi:anti-sigma factor domain-containing protein [Paenibacillus allorhizosphaerae]|uniref:Anti-sigma factor n=1 Tax=Paenibacillus allorhizosphaerae TaxID=2849866 RepID=A0ABM8VIT6_9BACL|nr:anti-sigma factor [Paenibacillus allorhizosphaerae]CAG7644465.1 hypothetical protein PAECIP111802_03275 [Paenibacillus allorhizosphaerae]
MNEERNRCEQLISFFLGEMTEEEEKAFERHMSECSDCREELMQLQEAWSVIPYSMDPLEPQAELKVETLGAILDGSEGKPVATEILPEHTERLKYQRSEEQSQAVAPYEPSQQAPAVRPEPSEAQPVPAVRYEQVVKRPETVLERIRRRSPRYAAAAVLLVLLLGYAGWLQLSQWQQQDPRAQPDLQLPAHVLGAYNLKPFDPAMPAARGQAWLMKQGGTMQLVLQASGLPELQGEQAYQVWLVKNGDRVNGGTFRVDAQGNGVLTYKIDEAERSFDTIGITLEPDPKGTKPRGKKVLGT